LYLGHPTLGVGMGALDLTSRPLQFRTYFLPAGDGLFGKLFGPLPLSFGLGTTFDKRSRPVVSKFEFHFNVALLSRSISALAQFAVAAAFRFATLFPGGTCFGRAISTIAACFSIACRTIAFTFITIVRAVFAIIVSIIPFVARFFAILTFTFAFPRFILRKRSRRRGTR
jgi:hypothetical protein